MLIAVFSCQWNAIPVRLFVLGVTVTLTLLLCSDLLFDGEQSLEYPQKVRPGSSTTHRHRRRFVLSAYQPPAVIM